MIPSSVSSPVFALRFLSAASSGAVLLVLAGCAGVIGPDFVAPTAPAVDGYTATPLPARTAAANAAGGQAQTFQIGANVPDRWWTLFGSATINRLVDEALAVGLGCFGGLGSGHVSSLREQGLQESVPRLGLHCLAGPQPHCTTDRDTS